MSLTQNVPHDELVMTRLIRAHRELIFDAWSQAQHLTHWFGPRGYTCQTETIEIKPGGEWRFTATSPEGEEYYNRIRFETIKPPESMTYLHDNGTDNDENAFQAVVSFEEEESFTRLTLRLKFRSVAACQAMLDSGVMEAGETTFDKLSERVAQTAHAAKMLPAQPLVITRMFNAPRKRVFDAFSQKEALARWWGSKGSKTDVLSFDFKVGGHFHYLMTMENGMKMYGRFDYLEIEAPERIVFRSCFADGQGQTVRAPFSEHWPLFVHNILKFEEYGQKTLLVMTGEPVDVSDSEAQMFLGFHDNMQQGYAGTMELLEAYLQTAQ